ncbi:MAG: sigma-70 family RNA polymerase sigma factor [Acidimicrobiales bacterium]|nr:sigma-70 family RNA polymerase sigma factor [Acidimicrobiales bacterium]
MEVTGDPEWVAGQFEANRSRLEGMAFRMLGSRPEAEDAVQEAWLRISRADPAAVENLAGWLTTVTGRICLDRLRWRRVRPEDLVGVDVAVGDDPAVGQDPADAVVLAESVGAALLVVLDAMAPEERVAFVLHDVFGVPFDTIGEVVGRSPQAARQLASRARRRVQGAPSAEPEDTVQHRALVEAFLRAAREGDFEGLVRLLHPDVAFRPDQFALDMGSRPEMQGARDVATAIGGGARGARLVTIDGRAALAWAPGGRVRSVIEFRVEDDRITAIAVTADPGRLGAVDLGRTAD